LWASEHLKVLAKQDVTLVGERPPLVSSLLEVFVGILQRTELVIGVNMYAIATRKIQVETVGLLAEMPIPLGHFTGFDA
jgi:hypothetical protein